ncbi:MAG: glycosyltransferase family 4 protein [Nitrospirota bacterium]
MKIIQIITRLDQGGSAEAVMQIGEGLSKKGHDVRIITGFTKEPQEDFEEYSKRTGVPLTVVQKIKREISPLFDFYSFCKLYRFVKEERPEVVHTHTSKAGILGRWAAWLNGVKVIIHSTHGHIFYGYFGWIKTKLFFWTERITAGITDRVTTLTDLEIEDYQRLRLARREKYITIPYGIDTKKFQGSEKTREEVRQILGLSSEDKVIGWIGRLVPVKDCGTFLKAAFLLKDKTGRSPELKNMKFLIVGDGPERKKMEEMAEKLGVKAIFTGTRKDICDIIPSMDILVLSSLNEGLGRVLLEAMAAGKPVVATKVGGVPEVVKDGITGILVPPSNPEEMASAVMKILTAPEMADAMGEEGRIRSEGFDIQIAIDNLESLYKGFEGSGSQGAR